MSFKRVLGSAICLLGGLCCLNSGAYAKQGFYKEYHRPISYDYLSIVYGSNKNERNQKTSGFQFGASYEVVDHLILKGSLTSGDSEGQDFFALRSGAALYATVFPHLDLGIGINIGSNRYSTYDAYIDTLSKEEVDVVDYQGWLVFQPAASLIVSGAYGRETFREPDRLFEYYRIKTNLQVTKKIKLTGSYEFNWELSDPSEISGTRWMFGTEYHL